MQQHLTSILIVRNILTLASQVGSPCNVHHCESSGSIPEQSTCDLGWMKWEWDRVPRHLQMPPYHKRPAVTLYVCNIDSITTATVSFAKWDIKSTS